MGGIRSAQQRLPNLKLGPRRRFFQWGKGVVAKTQKTSLIMCHFSQCEICTRRHSSTPFLVTQGISYLFF